MPKVLLADDSTHAQRMGTRILAGEGIEVITVSNGEAAAKKLSSEEFDLVLADIFMPGRTGYEVCTLIKKSPKLALIPVVLVVGQLEPYDPDQGTSVGADAVLKKPFEASIVIKTVRDLLESSAKKRAATAPPPPEPAEAADTQSHHHEPSAATPAMMEVPVDMAEMAMSIDLGHGSEAAAGPDMSVFAIPGQEEQPQPVLAEPPAPSVVSPDMSGLTLDLTSFTSEFRTEPPLAEPPATDVPAAEAPVAAEAAAAEAAAGPQVLDISTEEAPAVPAETPAEQPPAAQESKQDEPFQFESIAEQATTAGGFAPAAAAAVMARDVRWQATTETVAAEDRAVFGSAQPAASAQAAPAVGAVHEEWADLLATVEEQASAAQATTVPAESVTAETAADCALPEPAPAVAEPEAAVVEPMAATATVEDGVERVAEESEPVAVEAPVEVAEPAEPAAATVAPLQEPVIIEADVLQPGITVDPVAAVSQVVQEAVAIAPNAAELRQAIDAGLNKALPGITAYPGLVDRVMEEVLARLGPHLRK